MLLGGVEGRGDELGLGVLGRHFIMISFRFIFIFALTLIRSSIIQLTIIFILCFFPIPPIHIPRHILFALLLPFILLIIHEGFNPLNNLFSSEIYLFRSIDLIPELKIHGFIDLRRHFLAICQICWMIINEWVDI